MNKLEWGFQIEISWRVASDFFTREQLFNFEFFNKGVKGKTFWKSGIITILGFKLGVGLFIRFPPKTEVIH